MLSEVDWGAHDSSFFLFLQYIDHDGDPNDFFNQGTAERTTKKEYLKDSLDTGQTKDGFFNFKSIKEYRGSYTLSDP